MRAAGLKGQYNLTTTKCIYFSHHVIICEFRYNEHVKQRFSHSQNVQINTGIKKGIKIKIKKNEKGKNHYRKLFTCCKLVDCLTISNILQCCCAWCHSNQEHSYTRTLGAPDHPDTRTQCLVPSSALYQSSENNAHYLQQIFQKKLFFLDFSNYI